MNKEGLFMGPDPWQRIAPRLDELPQKEEGYAARLERLEREVAELRAALLLP